MKRAAADIAIALLLDELDHQSADSNERSMRAMRNHAAGLENPGQYKSGYLRAYAPCPRTCASLRRTAKLLTKNP